MYLSELNRAMLMLAEHPQTLFVGQAVRYSGQAAFKSFDGVPMDRRIELPVAEDFQMGLCTGLSLEGYIPVSFYTRWDFLILAMNQLVNHLDKLPYMGWSPKVIIRTAVGRTAPLDPGPQHSQNHTLAVSQMLHTVKVVDLQEKKDIVPAYEEALRSHSSTILVEHMRLY